MNESYMIAERNLHGFYHEIAKLNKRAAKLGVAPIVLSKTGKVESVERKHDITGAVIEIRRKIEVQVTGEAPKFNGWRLAAVLEVTPEGTIIRKEPACKIELAQYRQSVHKCDHCNLERRRSETFLVVHDDGAVKQIGRQCIKDFLGHKDPHQLAKWAEIIFSLAELAEGCEEGDFFGGGGGSNNLVHVGSMLSYAALAIRMRGYVSATRAAEDFSGNTVSTKIRALAWMNPGENDKLGKDYWMPEEIDAARGNDARQYVLDTLGAKDPAELSDFDNNLLIACKCEAVDSRNAGIIAFVPEYFARQTEKRVEAERITKTPPCHFGVVGQKVVAEKLTYLKSSGFESSYGYCFLHSFQHASGARILWKTSTELSLSAGEEVNAKFTVKEHSEYNGFPQTKVLRMKVWNDRIAFE